MSVEGKIIPPGGGTTSPETTGSSGLTRRHLIMGASLLAVSGLAFARTPKRRYPNLSEKYYEGMFPPAFGDWRTLPVSELVLPPESDLANRMYQHILTRTYVNSQGVAIMFLAAYNSEQLNNVQLHRPEICYYASGFSIDASSPYDLPLTGSEYIPARSVTASMGSRIENIVYWTRIGDQFPQSWAAQRIAMTKANLEGYLADGLLLRISVINPNREKSLEQMAGFMRDMIAHTGKPGRQMIVGTIA